MDTNLDSLEAISEALLGPPLPVLKHDPAVLPSEIVALLEQSLCPVAFLQRYLTEEGIPLPPSGLKSLSHQEYAQLVSGACHNACLWGTKRLLDTLPQELLSNLSWHTGGYRMKLSFSSTVLSHDHSWFEITQGGKNVILDLTLSQFDSTLPKLFIGERNDRVCTYAEIKLTAPKQALAEFALAL